MVILLRVCVLVRFRIVCVFVCVQGKRACVLSNCCCGACAIIDNQEYYIHSKSNKPNDICCSTVCEMYGFIFTQTMSIKLYPNL